MNKNIFVRISPIIIVSLFVLFIFIGTLSAVNTDFYWEAPSRLSRGNGAYPQAVKSAGRIISVWQENEFSGENGKAWLSLSSFGENEVIKKDRFIGPLQFSGEAPIMFSIACDNNDTLLIAAASGDNKISIYKSKDGAQTFSEPIDITLETEVVAPRLFPNSKGGWYLFTTRTQNFSKESGSQTNEYQALSIFYSVSKDGYSWSDAKPFVGGTLGLDPNFLPSVGSINGKDIVVFQSLKIGTGRPTYQLFSAVSSDGGTTWSNPKEITTFTDPIRKDVTVPESFDNQRPHLANIGGKLWLTWERKTQSGKEQIYISQIDNNGNLFNSTINRVTLDRGTCLEPRLFDADGELGVSWFDDRRGNNRVYSAIQSGAMWNEQDLSGRLQGEATFGRVLYSPKGLYVFWQSGTQSKSSVIGMVPDTSSPSPRIAALDFVPNTPTRRDQVNFSWNVPEDSSGVSGFAWSWSQDKNEKPDKSKLVLVTQTRTSQIANNDGPWYFSLCTQDYAGNWSDPSVVVFNRDTTPPGAPTILPPQASDDGFLASNSPVVSWIEPLEPDVAGYTWAISFIGDLDRLPARKRKQNTESNSLSDSTSVSASVNTSEGISDSTSVSASVSASENSQETIYSLFPISEYEESLLDNSPEIKLQQSIRTRSKETSFSNLDDGYWLFSVAAIDGVGNTGEASSFIMRADKFIPYTTVNDISIKRDIFGSMNLSIIGRGFSEDGPIDAVIIDLDGKEPYDRYYELENKEFTIISDRILQIDEVKDLEVGSYRIGLHHNTRGWYFTSPRLRVDYSGTVKYGERGETWKPSWTFSTIEKKLINTETLLLLLVLIVPALGIFLSVRQIRILIVEGQAAKLEAIALLEGKPMPEAERKEAEKNAMKRGAGLSAKFMLAISALVLFVVAIVSIPLTTQMLSSQSSILARGLEQRANVLLESVAQGAKSYLPARNVLELSLLPNQASGVEEAKYLTITGYGTGNNTSPEAVWASNDPDIVTKLNTESLNPGVSMLKDVLSDNIEKMSSELNEKAQKEVSSIAEAIQQIQEEGQILSLRFDDESQARMEQLSTTSRDLEKTLSERLSTLANASVSSEPFFDPSSIKLEPEEYIFYKPILFRQGRETNYYRGLVRLSVSTEGIVAEVLEARTTLIKSIVIVAAIALVIGVLGSIMLSSVITRPIMKVIKGVQIIKDTPDKKDLADFSIQVKSKDELALLASAINEMTAGLVHAASEAEMLTVGKEVQKMFIPLHTNRIGEKLTTGSEDTPTQSFYGYYEGAKGVSGDYFDYRSLDGRFYAFIKCDVSGKGVPAALIMVGVATIFSTEFQYWSYKQNGIHLDKLTYKVNDFIEKRGFKGRFAAFLMGVYDNKTGYAYVCHAGDNLVHIYKENEGKLVTLTLDQAPTAGTFPNDMVEITAPYKQTLIKMDPGDSLLLYTDGFEEATRAQRGRDFKQLFTLVASKDKDGKDSEFKELLVEQLGEERINIASEAIMKKQVYELVKENDPLGPDMIYHFDFGKLDASSENLVLGLASIEKVFRMVPDPNATIDDCVMVDVKIDATLKKCWTEYNRFCSHTKPHPDPNKQEYMFYTHLKEDDQYDDLTMMLIRRNS